MRSRIHIRRWLTVVSLCGGAPAFAEGALHYDGVTFGLLFLLVLLVVGVTVVVFLVARKIIQSLSAGSEEAQDAAPELPAARIVQDRNKR